ncbi:DoxX family protein [Gammaproteobacteria bacterium]|jgi:putative oxidoreductase|nr:DoxX family protein [Gammaproteobacteria bacterium]MDA9173917.1 DoxX family protein [Gammaproteobacteria bacterium]MDA9804682.1 DoxX family protein [Gammaproteobacteria bacterium]MDA9903476.1 DoxX family protein [Gammaproteobacteria bacterium]MDB4848689.1 DoxX family protein [Gammaproteobacteria bacterium]
MLNIKKIDDASFLIGRTILGLYFFIFGFAKLFTYHDISALMLLKGVPLVTITLPMTIIIQTVFGLFLVFGKNLRISGLILFVLTFLINYYIHNFWDLSGDPSQAHEMQNFVKNTAIAGGLLILATKENN